VVETWSSFRSLRTRAASSKDRAPPCPRARCAKVVTGRPGRGPSASGAKATPRHCSYSNGSRKCAPWAAILCGRTVHGACCRDLGACQGSIVRLVTKPDDVRDGSEADVNTSARSQSPLVFKARGFQNSLPHSAGSAQLGVAHGGHFYLLYQQRSRLGILGRQGIGGARSHAHIHE
jgi:hypothetical protein